MLNNTCYRSSACPHPLCPLPVPTVYAAITFKLCLPRCIGIRLSFKLILIRETTHKLVQRSWELFRNCALLKNIRLRVNNSLYNQLSKEKKTSLFCARILCWKLLDQGKTMTLELFSESLYHLCVLKLARSGQQIRIYPLT